MSREERTGWRDQSLSLRHRDWGNDCPAADMDFILIEYDRAQPTALIEYKQKNAHVYAKSANIRALQNLAAKASLPLFIVFYDEKQWWFKVYPANTEARSFIEDPEIMTEREYVTFLYRIRHRTFRESFARITLNDFKPDSFVADISTN